MSKKKFSDSISSKGYYIALVLCALAIGITGYLYYRNMDSEAAQLQQPTSAVISNMPDKQDVEAVATTPGSSKTEQPEPTPGSNEPAKKPAKTVSPVVGETVATYSMDALHYNPTTRDWRVHNGMDIAAEAGTEVCAAADGTVYTVYEDETMGTTVVITHDGGYTTRYASLAQEVSVQAGDSVKAGQVIGMAGNTALLETAVGDHVHFSVSCDGKPVDPADFLS